MVGMKARDKTIMMAAFGDKYKHPDSSFSLRYKKELSLNTAKRNKEENKYMIGFRLSLVPIDHPEEQLHIYKEI